MGGEIFVIDLPLLQHWKNIGYKLPPRNYALVQNYFR
jgi:hypothetical protein